MESTTTRSTRTSRPDLRLCVLAAVLWALSVGGASAAGGAGLPNIVTVDAYSTAPDVVETEAGEERSPPLRRSLGFVVEEEGFALTTYRAVVDPESGRLAPHVEITVREDGSRRVASIVGVEPTIDLAVLSIETPQPLRASRVRGEGGLDVGVEVQLPTTLDGTDLGLTVGRIVGLNTRECYQESLTSTMFRAEFLTHPEAAGAPLFTGDGVVVGLYTAYEPTAASGHAEDAGEVHVLPIALAFNIYDSIKQKKSLRSPWTGFSVRSLDDEERRFFPAPRGHAGGVAVESVWENSPAARMGVREGDLLVQLSHNRIASVADFQKWLYLYGVGAPVKLVFLRDGTEYLVADYTIEERPAWARPR